MEQPREALGTSVLRALWACADGIRRRQGEFLESLGFGPDITPSRIAGAWSTARLLAYQAPRPARPALLLVPAPIKAAYIWDLAPEVSVVRRCLAGGMQVYLMEWQRPQPGDEGLGLAEYADRLILNCLDAVSAETGQSQAFVAGHSLGGTLAAIFASLYPARLRGLIELEGPMYFSPDAGRLESAVSASPSAAVVCDGLGNIPGSFLNMASTWADPATFEWEPWIDWLASSASPEASRRHWRVARWALDEMPMPRRLFEEVVDGLYRENRFADGALHVGGRVADAKAVSAPVLAVTDPRSRVVPPISVEAYRAHTASTDVQILEYREEVGVMLQHVGVLMGESAHRTLWPRTVAWLHQHSYTPVTTQ